MAGLVVIIVLLLQLVAEPATKAKESDNRKKRRERKNRVAKVLCQIFGCKWNFLVKTAKRTRPDVLSVEENFAMTVSSSSWMVAHISFCY